MWSHPYLWFSKFQKFLVTWLRHQYVNIELRLTSNNSSLNTNITLSSASRCKIDRFFLFSKKVINLNSLLIQNGLAYSKCLNSQRHLVIDCIVRINTHFLKLEPIIFESLDLRHQLLELGGIQQLEIGVEWPLHSVQLHEIRRAKMPLNCWVVDYLFA